MQTMDANGLQPKKRNPGRLLGLPGGGFFDLAGQFLARKRLPF